MPRHIIINATDPLLESCCGTDRADRSCNVQCSAVQSGEIMMQGRARNGILGPHQWAADRVVLYGITKTSNGQRIE